METKHTPGPWFIDQFGHVYGWTEGKRIDSGGTQKDSVVLVDNRYSQATRHDKMLIAAAPELLAALEMVEEAFMHKPGPENIAGNKARTAPLKYCNAEFSAALNAARRPQLAFRSRAPPR